MKKRVVSFFLTVALMVTVFVRPASASLVIPPAAGALAIPGGVAAGVAGVVTVPTFAVATGGLIAGVAAVIGYLEDHVQDVLNVLVSITGVGNVGKDKLESSCNYLNQIAENPHKYSDLLFQNGLELDIIGRDMNNEVFETILFQLISWQSDINNWHVIYHQDYGYVIANANETYILSDSIGRYPYYLENTDLWFSESEALKNSSLHVATQYMLDNLQAQQESLHPDYSIRQVTIRFSDGNRYKVIKRDAPGVVGSFILCDQLGFPYGIPEGNTQMGGDRNYNDDKENQPETSEDPIVDIDGDLVMQMFPDGSFTWINSVIYDASNKTYNVDASTSYNIDNNTYYNYEWHYTYHINYTSITYIGQTEEYDKYYEYYFDLPDGRSSADLTAEELLALNTQIDVLPYIRSADDTSIRALYHFDGDTQDSSYWSHLGEFKWNKGASITYMDAGAFEGALYLDENEHDFSIKLPSNIGSGDFTLQFRYYQSHTLTPTLDSFVYLGNTKLLGLNGSELTSASGGSKFSGYSVGVWNEICLMRNNGVIYRLLNGVPISTNESSAIFSDFVRFQFGGEQQTYKYFDEFRFVNKAVYPVDGYTPSSVPFDTNLALVLPDSQLPVADEYWIFNDDDNVLDISSYLGLGSLDSVAKTISNTYYYNSYSTNFGLLNLWTYYDSGSLSFLANDGGLSFVNSGTEYSPLYKGSGTNLTVTFPVNAAKNAFVMPVGYNRSVGGSRFAYFPAWDEFEQAYLYSALPTDTVFSFSIVTSSGDHVSIQFTMDAVEYRTGAVNQSFWNSELQSVEIPGGGKLVLAPSYQPGTFDDGFSTYYYVLICPPAGGSVDVVYAELKAGSPNEGHEFVSSVVVMDKDDLNTPSLAVRTDLDITGYQLGGVRPSLPEKGLVWAMVESGRITSLQIYNGQAWEQVDGRIWTGSRWVPYYAYDLLLLKDLYDIVESDPSLDYIYTEAGFWKWLQNAWGEMMKKLDQIAAGSGGSGSGSGETKSFWNRIADAFTAGLTALIEGVFSLITEILKTLLSLVTDMLSFLFSFIGETVLGGISDFFSAFTDGSLLDGFQQTDESGNTTTQLPEGVAAVFTDISGMISALPADLLSVLVIGIALLFLLGVIMLIL